mgnify:CR=1|jgi:hypothetical protein
MKKVKAPLSTKHLEGIRVNGILYLPPGEEREFTPRKKKWHKTKDEKSDKPTQQE